MTIKYGVVKCIENHGSSSEQKTIIAIISSPEIFRKSILDINEKYLENVTKDQLLELDTFLPGKYLIGGDNKYELYEKETIVSEGYFYNSSYPKITRVCCWELLPYIPSPPNTVQQLQGLQQSICDNPDSKSKSNIVNIVDQSLVPVANSNPVTDSNFDKSLPNVLPLNLDDMCTRPSNILLIGRRGSGKTFMIRDILKNMPNEVIANCMIVSAAEKMSPFYKSFFPDAKVIGSYDNSGAISSFIEDNIPGVIILDNYITTAPSKLNEFRNLIFNSRCYKKTVITAVQFPVNFTPEIRINFDYVFLLDEHFSSYKKKIYDQYGNNFNSFTEFNTIFGNITIKSYNAMVIHQGPRETNIYEYKASN